MRTIEIILTFETSFTTTFKHTACYKWGVDFENSNIQHTLSQLQQLKHNMQYGHPAPVHVGYEINLQDAARAEALLLELLNRWKQITRVPHHPKLYPFLHQLRELETPSEDERAERIVKKILTPKPSPQQTKEEQKQAKIDAMKRELYLKGIQKKNTKR